MWEYGGGGGRRGEQWRSGDNSTSLSLSPCMCVCVHVHICICIYIHVYLYYRGAENSVPAARAKTARENVVTLIVNKLPKCKKVYVKIGMCLSYLKINMPVKKSSYLATFFRQLWTNLRN